MVARSKGVDGNIRFTGRKKRSGGKKGGKNTAVLKMRERESRIVGKKGTPEPYQSKIILIRSAECRGQR